VTGLMRERVHATFEATTFSLRLENILMGEAAAKKKNCFDAIIEKSLYFGAFIKYRVRLGKSTVLDIKKIISLWEQNFVWGSKVLIGWDSDDMRLVDEPK
jgi:ABC-type Fe3+/spermidine/putrescine transport system ATPase subunit